MQGGRSIATTMGFTAVDGLMMGTRCGAIDPGVLLHSDGHAGNGCARDWRRCSIASPACLASPASPRTCALLRASPDARAAQAIALFVYRIVREIGSMAAALGGLDALIFTGGIGENDAATRAEVFGRLRLARPDPRSGTEPAGSDRVSTDQSTVSAWVVATDEEAMIARHTAAVLNT